MQHSLRRTIKWLGISLLCIQTLALTVALYYLTFDRHKPYQLHPTDFNLNYHDIAFTSYNDNLPLKGWLILPKNIPANAKVAVVIGVHGHHSNMARKGKANMLELVAKPLAANGIATFMFDLRNHGKSADARPVSMGFYEKNDVYGALRFIQNQNTYPLDTKNIGLFGWSLGASTVLQAMSAMKDPESRESIKGILADSPFTNAESPILSRLQDTALPDFTHSSIMFWIRSLSGIALDDIDLFKSFHAYDKNLLLVHAVDDKVTSPKETKEFYNFLKPKFAENSVQLWLSQTKGHCSTATQMHQAYQNRLVQFFQNSFSSLEISQDNSYNEEKPVIPTREETHGYSAEVSYTQTGTAKRL